MLETSCETFEYINPLNHSEMAFIIAWIAVIMHICHPAAWLGEWLPQEMPGDGWGGARAASQEGGSGLADPRNSADCLKILLTDFFSHHHHHNDCQWFFPFVLSLSLGLYLLSWWIYFTLCFFCKARFHQLFYEPIKQCGKTCTAFVLHKHSFTF